MLKQFNPKCLMWPSDYPHERLPDMFSHDIPEFLGRIDISDESKKAILHDNPIDFYPIKDLSGENSEIEIRIDANDRQK